MKGAYTGALNNRIGALKNADGGVLFLDEIGELGLEEQAMLLHAIEAKSFYPLGSDNEINSNFQLICGTNRDLSAEVATGRFRSDLLARIKCWTFELPKLKDRKDDIPPNIDKELSDWSQDNNTIINFDKDARKKYEHFAMSEAALWTANFRDLNYSIKRMCTYANANGTQINMSIVKEEINELLAAWTVKINSQVGTLLPASVGNLDEVDRVQLEYVIEVCRNSKNRAEAGRKLFSVSRLMRKSTNDSDSLVKYLAKYNLIWDDVKGCQG
jgi:transcriptional regulatory protein RtcR